MNKLLIPGFALALVVGFVAYAAADESSNVKITAEDGMIELFDGNDNKDCEFTFTTGKHRLGEGNKCRNDELYSFKLLNVPSAATIILSDAGDCGKDENFHFRLKTIKYEVTTVLVRLAEISSFEEGAVITPGLRLIEKHGTGGTVGGKWTCLEIIRSE